MKQKILLVLAFAITTVIMCIVNFLLQIVLIFIDVLSRRLQSTSAVIIVLWIVTGVFATVFTKGWAELLAGEKNASYRIVGDSILMISALAIIGVIFIMAGGHFRHNPSEFSLLLSNGYIFISYFIGAVIMAWITRKLDEK